MSEDVGNENSGRERELNGGGGSRVLPLENLRELQQQNICFWGEGYTDARQR